MYASCALGRKNSPPGKPEYIQQHIRQYQIWKDLTFWEEFFWDELSRVRKEQNAGGLLDEDPHFETSFHNHIIPRIIAGFAHDMIISWSLPRTVVTEFIIMMCSRNTIDKRTNDSLISDADTFISALESPQKQKEIEAKLKKKYKESRNKLTKDTKGSLSRASGGSVSVLSRDSSSGKKGEKAPSEIVAKVGAFVKVKDRDTMLFDSKDKSEKEAEPWIGKSKQWNRRSRQVTVSKKK